MKQGILKIGEVIRNCACLLEFGIVLMLAVCLLTSLTFGQDPVTGAEKREALEVAGAFAVHFDQTHDLSPLPNSPALFPALDLAGRVVAEVALEPSVARAVKPADIRELVVYYPNFGILMQRFEVLRRETDSPARPLEVEALLERHPVFLERLTGDPDRKLKTVPEFREYLMVLKEATGLMQAYFKKPQPEQSSAYQHSELLQTDSNQVIALPCSRFGDCPPALQNTRFFVVRKAGLQLLLARIDGKLKVVFAGPDAE